MVLKFKDNLREMRAQISIPEYLFWWAARIFMLLYIIQTFRNDHKWIDYLLPVIVGIGTFAVLLMRMITPKNSLFGRFSLFLYQASQISITFFSYEVFRFRSFCSCSSATFFLESG